MRPAGPPPEVCDTRAEADAYWHDVERDLAAEPSAAEVDAIEADVAAKAAERERNRAKSALWRETVAERNREWWQ